MKKKFIALFAACSMLSTAAMGLVQTAYADNDPVSIVVSNGATDTEKVLTFYYGFNDVACIEGNLSVNNGATIKSGSVTLQYESGMGDSTFNTSTGYMFVSSYGDGLTSADKSFATATITVPGDVDVTVTFTPVNLFDGAFDDYGTEVVTVTIPKKEETPSTVAAEVTKVEKQNEKQDNEEINGTGIYANQKAVIYGVEITPNDDTVTGATVALDGKSGEVDFGGEFTGSGTVVFAVILASESGVALSELGKDNVTPKVKTTIE